MVGTTDEKQAHRGHRGRPMGGPVDAVDSRDLESGIFPPLGERQTSVMSASGSRTVEPEAKRTHRNTAGNMVR